MWVETECGRTQGNWEYYAAADKRIRTIRNHFQAKKVSAKQVARAVAKITGLKRIDTDTEIAIEGKTCPKGRHRPTWERDEFEAWVKTQPAEYGRILGSPRVIVGFILNEEEE